MSEEELTTIRKFFGSPAKVTTEPVTTQEERSEAATENEVLRQFFPNLVKSSNGENEKIMAETIKENEETQMTDWATIHRFFPPTPIVTPAIGWATAQEKQEAGEHDKAAEAIFGIDSRKDVRTDSATEDIALFNKWFGKRVSIQAKKCSCKS